MSNVDEILSYKKNPDEDFYALLNCDESSSVSMRGQGGFCGNYVATNVCLNNFQSTKRKHFNPQFNYNLRLNTQTTLHFGISVQTWDSRSLLLKSNVNIFELNKYSRKENCAFFFLHWSARRLLMIYQISSSYPWWCCNILLCGLIFFWVCFRAWKKGAELSERKKLLRIK